MLCEFPNHPTGILSRKDRWRLFRKEDGGSYKIIRTLVLPFRKKNNIKRIVFYLSFALSSMIAALLMRRRDIIFASSPPIFHVFSALIAAKIKGAKFVLDVRDIWPDTAFHFKAIKGGRLMKWGSVLERRLYRDADLLTAVSRGTEETVSQRGGRGKTFVVYNGSSEDMLHWTGDVRGLRERLGWAGKFVVVYAGLMGLGQNLSAFLDNIASIDDDDILFSFIGDGPDKGKLMARAHELDLVNVQFMDLMPREKAIAITHAADAALVVLRESKFFESAIPSKFFDCMAAGKPVLTNVDGELRSLMEECGAGFYFSMSMKDSFKDAVSRLKEDNRLRAMMGESGRKFVQQRFLRSRIADEMVNLIESRLKCRAGDLT